ncbi:MAG: DEAD/DEAH box helicase [Phycisphaerales bacterium]|nr:DEAD/DEAH box helicase [Phycisphaerales bacterium]
MNDSMMNHSPASSSTHSTSPHHHTSRAAEPAAFPIHASKNAPEAGPTKTFADLGLMPMLLEAVKSEGYTIPTAIQAATIPAGLAGRDILGSAQTGTGKTAAFALPILQRLQQALPDKATRGPVFPRALILSPTRELASQIAESFTTYGKNTVLRHTTVYGGVSQFHQVKALRNGVDVLVATPGRLMDLMNQRLINLSQVSIFVLDEADRMLDMGFIEPIRKIASALPPREKVARQTMLFSATMPREIQGLAESLLKDPLRIAVTPANSTVALIEQSLYIVPKDKKAYLLEHLLEEGNIRRAVVFTRTKFGAERLGKKLNMAGITAESIHGDKNQNARKRALSRFKDAQARVLVATDVAARGLDVDAITHVFNFDLPYEPEAYVHRIGRTGRAGAKGMAISFCDPAEQGLLRAVERFTKVRIPQVTKIPDIRARMTADSQREATAHAPSNFQSAREGQAARQENGGRQQSGYRERPAYLGHAPRTPHSAPHAPASHGSAPHGDRPQRTRRENVPTTLHEHKAQVNHSHTPAHAPKVAASAHKAPAHAGKPNAGFAGPRPGAKPGWASNGRSRAPGKGVRPSNGR